MALVSVLIPTFNRLDLVREAIASVRAQTYPHYEIIVADDGSEDGTVAALRAEGIQVLELPHGGQPRARNAALRKAQGEFVCCLDSDDLWQPTFLEKCVTAIRTLDAAFVFANWTALNEKRQPFPSYFQKFYRWDLFSASELTDWRVIWPAETRAMFVDSCMSPSSSLLLRRELVNSWNENLEIGDDWFLLLEMCVKQACKVGFTLEALWYKRVQSDNIYDQRNSVEVMRILHTKETRYMRNQLRRQLSPQEYARLSAHIVYFYIQLLRRSPDIPKSNLLVTCLQGLFHSPSQFFDRLRDLSPRLRQWFPK